MPEATLAPLSAWDSYYVIVGSSAAALTGLQFVVIALVAQMRSRGSSATIDAFATPTVVHFCVALLVAATLSAPWDTLREPAVALAITGLAGLAYAAIVVRRTRRQTGYQPVFEDWLWHAALPVIGYAALTVAALTLPYQAHGALFVVAGVTLLLVFIGIHNAWDTVTFITLQRLSANAEASVAATEPAEVAPAEPGLP